MMEHGQEHSSSENIHCIWMDAGVVSYKLCDSGLDCDRCSFHHGMLQHAHSQANCLHSELDNADALSDITRASPLEDSIDDLIDRLLLPIVQTAFPGDRQYSHHHMWVTPTENGEYSIGIDHVVPQLVSSIHGIVLPRRLTRLHQDEPFAWLLASAGVLPLPAPLNGIIVDSNLGLTDHPEWLMGSPYDQAWIVRATGDSAQNPDQFLMPADQIRVSSQLEVERMQAWIRKHSFGTQDQQLTLCDGGLYVRSLQELLGQKHYPHFLREFLSIQPR